MLISIMCWVALGVIVGLIAKTMVDLRGDEPAFGIGAAVVGAAIFGVGHGYLSGRGVVAWDVWNLLFAAIGAAVGAAAWHAIRSRTISHERGTTRSSY